MIKLSPLGSFYLQASCYSRPCPLEALMLRGQPGHLPPTHPYCPEVEGLALREGRGSPPSTAHPPQPLPPPPLAFLTVRQQPQWCHALIWAILGGLPSLTSWVWPPLRCIWGMRNFFFSRWKFRTQRFLKKSRIVCDITKLSIPKNLKMCVCVYI